MMKLFPALKSATAKAGTSPHSQSSISASPAQAAAAAGKANPPTSPSSTLPDYARLPLHVDTLDEKKPTARTPDHTRPNSPELEVDSAPDNSTKKVESPPVCYWILQHAESAPPKKAHPDFPAILVIRPDVDGFIVDTMTQTTRSTIGVTKQELMYDKTRHYTDLQSENLAKLLLIHYKRVLPGHLAQDDGVLMHDLYQLEMEHRIKRCVIDDPKRLKSFTCALEARPVHRDTISQMVGKLETKKRDEVLKLDYNIGHALRQYKQTTARVAVLFNGEPSSRNLADSIVSAWSELSPSAPQRATSFTSTGIDPEVELASAINKYCTLEKEMLTYKSFLQLAAWKCTPEQQQVWGAPLKCLFDMIKPTLIQRYWVDCEHLFEYPSVENALALVNRLQDMAVIRSFSIINMMRSEMDEQFTSARSEWGRLYPHLATPMTDAINQHFDTTTLRSLVNYCSGYYSNLRNQATGLLAKARKLPRGQPLVQPLEMLMAGIRKMDDKLGDVNNLQMFVRVFGGRQDAVTAHGIQNHVHLDAALVTVPQNALKAKKNKHTLLLFGPRLLSVEGELLFAGRPVKETNHIEMALLNLGQTVLKVRRSWDIATIAMSMVAPASEGHPVILEVTDSAHDTFEYRVDIGNADAFMSKFDAAQATFAFPTKTEQGSGKSSGTGGGACVKVATQDPDAVESLFIGAMEGVKSAYEMGAMYDHLVYCGQPGEAEISTWTPSTCATMSRVTAVNDGGYSVTFSFLEQSGLSRHPTKVSTQAETIAQVAAILHKHLSHYNCIFNATYASPNARARTVAFRSKLLGHTAIQQITSGTFKVMKRKHIRGGTMDTMTTASMTNVRSDAKVFVPSTLTPLKDYVESVVDAVCGSLHSKQVETSPEKLKSPTKMENILGNRGLALGGTFGAGFGRPGSIAGSLNSIGSRLTSVGRMVMGKDNQLQGPATLQSVLFSASTYFMDLVISGINLSMVPANGAANASLEVIAPVGPTSSKSHKTRWTMVHMPMLDELRKSGKFKPDLARTMFPVAVFNALSEYYSGVDAVLSISQFTALLGNVKGAVRTFVNFQSEIQPVINELLEPVKDGGSNGQPTPSNLLKNENLRLFLFILYLFEFSRIQFSDRLHMCFPQPMSSEPFHQLMAAKVSTSTLVMGALLKGSTGSSNRPSDIALAKKLLIGLAAPAIADKLKSEAKNKRIIGSPRALMDKMADMEKRIASRIAANKSEKAPLRSIVQMQEAAEEWKRWSEAHTIESRAKATAAAKAVAAANKSAPSSPKIPIISIPGVFKGIPTADSGAATLARPQPMSEADQDEHMALKCALPLSRQGSDAAIELRHATSSEATVADQGNQPTSLGAGKLIDSVEAAVGHLSIAGQ